MTTRRPAQGQGRPREAAPGDKRGARQRFFHRRRVCAFCVSKVKHIDYKDPVMLRRYISERSKIDPRRRTGTCAKHQRMLTIALKRARFLALLPYAPDHLAETGPVVVVE